MDTVDLSKLTDDELLVEYYSFNYSDKGRADALLDEIERRRLNI